MNIAIAGGTGFIGTALTNYFVSQGHQLYILTRTPGEQKENVKYVQWLIPNSNPLEELPKLDAFINLAGDSIGSGRWTPQKKKRIVESRLTATKASISLLNQISPKPDVFINASAIGYYGHSFDQTFTEDEDHGGDANFLQNVVKQWEAEALKMEQQNIRVVLPRLGLVLDRHEGALSKMILPYRLFIGGNLGTGKQWYSWVHIEDVVRMFDFAIHNDQISGAMNITAPHPVQMKNMGKTLAAILRRPHWLPVPSFALKLVLGEMSSLLLEGQQVLPEKAIQSGYTFVFPTLDKALTSLLKSSS